MAKLVTKFKILNQNSGKKLGGYVEYIAKRENVEKIDDTKKLKTATLKQKELIEKILNDLSDCKDMHEYKDYIKNPTLGNATEFISRVLEDNSATVMNNKTYADYIGTRPRVEKQGTHGLFTYEGEEVNLKSVSENINKHGGKVWTVIVSVRREDAERLGYNTGERWRTMLRNRANDLSEALNIPLQNLKWYGAFHNESYHPHIHLIAYSVKENEGYLSKKGVAKLRKAYATDIFNQDLVSIYEKKDEARKAINDKSREIISDIVEEIKRSTYSNMTVENLFLQLAERLSRTKGKKQYGYLKSDVKAIVNNIVAEIAKDKRIATLYDLWYESKENVIKTYTEALPERVPLCDNNEFKAIRNAVVSEAASIVDKADEEKRKEYATTSTINLFHHIGRIFENKCLSESDTGKVDRKTYQKINEKKKAMGLNQG
jgi:hypothetical protein